MTREHHDSRETQPMTIGGKPMNSRSGLTLPELLIVLCVVAGLIAGAWLTRPHRHSAAGRVACLGNLKQIGTTAAIYADKHGGQLPVAPGPNPRAFESLNLLARDQRYFLPLIFICPESQEVEAECYPNIAFDLDAESNSYAWIGRPAKNTSNPQWAVGSDACLENHAQGMNVVYIGGNAEWVPLDQLPTGEVLPLLLVDNNGERPKR